MLHGESKVIQRCFDDNNDDNKRWCKSDDKKPKDQSKNNSSESKINQRTTPVNQEQFKTQDSRIKWRLNQDKYEKFFSKIV